MAVRPADLGIDAADPIGVAVFSLAIRVENTQGRAFAEILPVTADRRPDLAGQLDRIRLVDARKHDEIDVVFRHEKTEGAARRHLAGELEAEAWILDRPGEDRLNGRYEEVRTFEEKLPLLVELKCESLVGRKLKRVGLDLRKVRIVGGVEGQAGGDPPTQRNARFDLVVLLR